jgi:hypothetical protein
MVAVPSWYIGIERCPVRTCIFIQPGRAYYWTEVQKTSDTATLGEGKVCGRVWGPYFARILHAPDRAGRRQAIKDGLPACEGVGQTGYATLTKRFFDCSHRLITAGPTDGDHVGALGGRLQRIGDESYQSWGLLLDWEANLTQHKA